MIRELLKNYNISEDTIEDISRLVENLFADGQLIPCEKKRVKVKPYNPKKKDNIIKAGSYKESKVPYEVSTEPREE